MQTQNRVCKIAKIAKNPQNFKDFGLFWLKTGCAKYAKWAANYAPVIWI